MRDLARRLGTSPTTVSEAWQTLARVGAIEARPAGHLRARRAPAARSAPLPAHHRGPGHFALDLSTRHPDPDLLARSRSGPRPREPPEPHHQLPRRPGPPALEETLRARWPFVPEMLTVVDGAMDALDRVASAVVATRRPRARREPVLPSAARSSGDSSEPSRSASNSTTRDCGPRRWRGLTHSPDCAVPPALRPQSRRRRPQRRPGRKAGVIAARHRRWWSSRTTHAGDIADGPLVSLGSHLPRTRCTCAASREPRTRSAPRRRRRSRRHRARRRRTAGILGPGWSSQLLERRSSNCSTTSARSISVARARRAYATGRLQCGLGRADRHDVRPRRHQPVDQGGRRARSVGDAGGAGVGVAPRYALHWCALPTDHVRLTVGQVHRRRCRTRSPVR